MTKVTFYFFAGECLERKGKRIYGKLIPITLISSILYPGAPENLSFREDVDGMPEAMISSSHMGVRFLMQVSLIQLSVPGT